MSNELLITSLPTGLTLLGKVYGSDGLQEGSNVAMTEPSTGVYKGDFSLAIADDDYAVSFETATKYYGSGALHVRNNLEVTIQQLEIKTEADARQALLNNFDPATDTVAHVTLVDTVTTNTDTAIDNTELLAQHAQTQADVEASKQQTYDLFTEGSNSDAFKVKGNSTAQELTRLRRIVVKMQKKR